MEEIKDELKNSYNNSVDSFNSRDYKNFFLHFRTSIEWMSKLMLFDIINNENEFDEIIDGEKSINRVDSKAYGLVKGYGNQKPTGKNLPLLVPKAYFYKHPDVISSYYDKDKERLRRGLESCSTEFARLYDLASVWLHSNKTTLDISVQATSCAAFISSYVDYIKSNHILSDKTTSYLETLEVYSFVDDNSAKESESKINELIVKLEQNEAALIEAQAMQLESEKKKLEAETRNSALEAEMADMQKTIDELNAKLAQISSQTPLSLTESEDEEIKMITDETPAKGKLKLSQVLKLSSESWDVDEKSMDDDQLDLIEMNNDKSMLVTGCAGSGKTVIAMHKAEQVANTGASVILIAYTKSLSAFMREGIDEKSLPYSFYHHHRWKDKLGMPHADYIIVDEIQDFTREEIQEFISAANKAYFFFGDSAQSIYKSYGKNTISIEEISELTGLIPMQLYNNYRLPRTIAKITQEYVGVNVNPYEDRVYQNKEKALPHFVYLPGFDEQMKAISDLIEKYARDIFDNKKIGILYPNNELVIKTCQRLKDNGTPCEFKYNAPDSQKSIDTLDFETYLPKIMTYHSAKGLQFDVVILPMYEGANDNESRKALYVAMTRTMHHLYVLYSTPTIEIPLSDVPTKLYLKTL